MSNDQQPAGADVEIVELIGPDAGPPLVVVPSRVLINGIDVGFVETGSLTVDPGDGRSPARVSLTLLPRSVSIRAKRKPSL